MVHASCFAHIAQQVEHFLGKEEVIGSNPIVSTKKGCVVEIIRYFRGPS